MSERFENDLSKEMNKFKKCPNPECGSMNNPQENFCVDCGEELPPGEDEEETEEGEKDNIDEEF